MKFRRNKKTKEHWFSYRIKLDRVQNSTENADLSSDELWARKRAEVIKYSIISTVLIILVGFLIYGGWRGEVAVTESARSGSIAAGSGEGSQSSAGSGSAAVPGAPGVVSGGSESGSSSGDGGGVSGSSDGFSVRDAVADGVAVERVFITPSGREVTGKALSKWSSRSKQITNELNKKYGQTATLKLWKIYEEQEDDGLHEFFAVVQPTGYFGDNAAIEVRYASGEGYYDNAYSPIYLGYMQAWNDYFSTPETSMAGLLYITIEPSGNLMLLPSGKLLTQEEIFSKNPQPVVVYLVGGISPSGDELAAKLTEFFKYVNKEYGVIQVDFPLRAVYVGSMDSFLYDPSNQQITIDGPVTEESFLVKANGTVILNG